MNLSPDDLRRFTDHDAADGETYPAESVARLFETGAIQSALPKALGGDGASLEDSVRVVEAISGASGSLGLIAVMPLGFAHLFAVGPEFAPEPWRAKWSEQVERGAGEYRAGRIFAACNSEKGAGGALSATKTIAGRTADGGFELTGEKILATSGRFAMTFFSTAKVSQEDLPGAGVVEVFFVKTDAPGVEILDDWDGFGMRSTESHSVRYANAPGELLGFPDFFEQWQPFQCFYPLFAAVPLGCAGAILRELSTPSPTSPALRLRFNEALMRYESLFAYLLETARTWRVGMGPAERARVLRAKTFVAQESTKLAAELFALGGGRSYRRGGRAARAFADSFAGTALRPPLALALETMSDSFEFPAGR